MKTRLMTMLAMITLWLLTTTLPAFAGWKEDYRAALNAGNRSRALLIVQDAAARTDAEAEYTLGQLYYTGMLVPRDAEQGYAWMLVGTENGYHLGHDSVMRVEKQLSSGQRERGKGLAKDIIRRKNK
jgi:TPR repeat protein